MARFLVQLLGENFLLSLDGEHGKFGFRTNRVIKAPSGDEAGRIAIIQVHQQLNQNRQIVNNIPDSSKIMIVSTINIGFFSYIKLKRQQSFDFFPETDISNDEMPGK